MSGLAPVRRALALGLVGLVACAPSAQRGRVVIMVVDGLRPDYVTAELMPNLNALAERGVRGLAHHAVFPTVTRVNGPSIFTGRHPGGHGLLGNAVYLPDVDDTRVLDASSADDLRAVDRATGGAVLTAPSLGEVLAGQGLVLFAASSGSSGSALLMNHTGAGAGLVHQEMTIPDTLGPIVAELLGPAPRIPFGGSSVPLVARAVDALLEIGLDRADADVLAVWLTEPDGTAHAFGIGSPRTVSVLSGVDAEIGRLIAGLEARGVLDDTDVLVTSDHGFTERTGDASLTELLVGAGLKVSPLSMDVVVAGDAIHVRDGGRERVGAIVRLLQQTEWIGPVFTRGEGGAESGAWPGTVSFAAVGWDHPRSADILTSADWTDAENEWGYSGEVLTRGVAGHGSASPWDIRATFVAAGPRIARGVVSQVPSGNVDLMPTALALLGAEPPEGLDGRVLTEILVGGVDPADVHVESVPIETTTTVDGVGYDLTVERSRVGRTVYLDGTRVTRTRR